MKKFLIVFTVFVLCFCYSFAHAGPCEDDYEQVFGILVVDDLTPDAIGWHGFDYQIYGSLNGWHLEVDFYWKSDTYPTWHWFKNTYDDFDEFTWCYSGTDDNVQYKVVFSTNSSNIYVDWMFCKDW